MTATPWPVGYPQGYREPDAVRALHLDTVAIRGTPAEHEVPAAEIDDWPLERWGRDGRVSCYVIGWYRDGLWQTRQEALAQQDREDDWCARRDALDRLLAHFVRLTSLRGANNAGPHDRLLSLTTRLGGMAGRLEADRHWQAPAADRHWLWQGDTAIMDWHNLVEGRRVEDVDIAAVALGQFVRPVYGHDAGRRARQD